MLKLLLAASVLLPSPVAPANIPLTIIQPDSIVQVVCHGIDALGRHYISAGTAFRVGPTGLMLSVNHVTSEPNCVIGGKPINLAYASPRSDFSELQGDEGPYLSIDCGGYVKGRKYLSIGFARGVSPATVIELEATGEHNGGQAILTGMVPVIPGMSGGPIIDEQTGRVVGVNNAENFERGLSWSLELKATPLCKGRVA